MATQVDASVHTRSRRRLNFGESQRFKGKTFFLDLLGYPRAEEIEKELTCRGATVEKFLVQSVRYLVTNKSKADIERATSDAKTPSGLSPHTPSTGGLSQLMSPYSNQSSSSDKKTAAVKPRYYTRTQKILQKALEKESNVRDKPDKVLSLAISWKCKILHVDTVERELKKLKPVTGASEGIQKMVDMSTVRKLRRPFFKVEDLSRNYRPVIYEPLQWPTINYDCPPDASPFDPPRPSLPSSSAQDSSKRAQRKDTPAGNERRLGYCEPCGARFEDLEKHLRSQQHQDYATNPKNFEKLDKLIMECNLKDFLLKVTEEKIKSKSTSPVKPVSLLRTDDVDRVSIVSLPPRNDNGLVILSDYPIQQSQEVSPGVCTRQMKKKLTESSPSLLPKYKRSRTF